LKFSSSGHIFVVVVPPVRDSSRRKKDVLDNLISNDMMTIGGRKKFINGQTEVTIHI